jgi:hypothetical protein
VVSVSEDHLHFIQDLENMPMLASLTQVTGSLPDMSLSRAPLLGRGRILCLIRQARRNKYMDMIPKFYVYIATKKGIKSNDKRILILTGFSKIFEILIYCRLNEHMSP